MAEEPKNRLVVPEDLVPQVPWDKAEGAVILLLMPSGEVNQVFMSSMTWAEAASLSKQFDIHLTHLHSGPMKEGF